MTTAVTAGNPAGPPSPSRGQGYSLPTRSQSTRARLTTPAATGGSPPHRAASHHHSASTNERRPVKDILPHEKYANETANVAAKRSSSKDPQPSPSTAARPDSSSRPQRRNSQRGTNGATADMPAAAATNAAAATAAQAAADPRNSGTQKQSRSRTTIPMASGKWILGKTIGAGSMGKVKLAKKADSNETLACKIIPRASPDDGHHSRAEKERADASKEIRTAREAAIGTLLNHPYICNLREVVRTSYHWYMLFEHVNGGQILDYIISHGKLKERAARKFSRQIGSALDYCHRNSIVHRDLKIENILVSKNGDIKIIDFGLSNLFAPRGHLQTFCGSLYFAAPELLQARAYTGPEVDVWSFGIVLYVLVCGKVPFDDQSMPALHAKIKKGVVDYPAWLSSDCKNLLSRMLVTDPKQRAGLGEVLNHPWMTKGYGGPPENYLPHREPLTLPLDNEVIIGMTGFNFGSPEQIKAQLTRLIESEEYQRGVKMLQREKENPQPSKEAEKKRSFGFDFYKRRNSTNSREHLTAPSSDGLPMGKDPLNAFDPTISIYYLVREKQERDRIDLQKTTSRKDVERAEREQEKEREKEKGKEKAPAVAEIAPPQAAYTNTSAYEMPGENATGGRTRPRARTHGEDDAPEEVKKAQPLSPTTPTTTHDANLLDVPKKESMGAGILRRLSTRRKKDPERLEKDRSHPPVAHGAAGYKKGLGRSTSVSSAEFARRRTVELKDPPATSGSDQAAPSNDKADTRKLNTLSSRSVSMRAKTLGHARRESIQARRARREAEARGERDGPVPEETDAEVERSGMSREGLDKDDPELNKPVFLKGLFSVSTTSSKPVPEIRADIKRVLHQLAVDYAEIKGGFSCRYQPSIDLKRTTTGPGEQGPSSGSEDSDTGAANGLRAGPSRHLRIPGPSPTTAMPAGETTTRVQDDTGAANMVLEFDIFIVKVPVISLYGIQFKRISGNTWQFKNMADQILRELRL